MLVARGDIGLAQVPFVAGSGAKVRPVLVVQNDHNNGRLNSTIVAVITTNTSRASEETQLLIDISTKDGAATGLLYDSAVKAETLVTIMQSDVHRVIGRLPDSLLTLFDACLRASLQIK